MPIHPLAKEFDMPSDDVTEIFGEKVTIPEDPTIQTVVHFALNQYKTMIEEASLLEEDQKLPYYEMAKEYLKIAKDAMVGDGDLNIKATKVKHQKEKDDEMISMKKNNKVLPKGDGSEDRSDGKEASVYDRASVWERIEARRRGEVIDVKEEKTKEPSG